jgi:hypothetical protein
MPLILGTNSIKDTGYDVANSCRFNNDDSAYMHKTPAGAGTSNTTFTWSIWIKRTDTATAIPRLFEFYNTSSYYISLRFRDDVAQNLDFYSESNGGAVHLRTNRRFRDVGAWYNIVMRVDTTNGTADDRLRMYVNGVQETSFAARTNPGSSENLNFNGADDVQYVGRKWEDSDYFDGYMAEVCYCDGQSLAPTSFGEFDSDSPTIWKPIDVSGLTFGTNGFYLDFEASANLGNDANGGADFTEVNIAAVDQCTDTPTNNFATYNGALGLGGTLAEGNCQYQTADSYDNSNTAFSSIGINKGKWYAEFLVTATSSGNSVIGAGYDPEKQQDGITNFCQSIDEGWGYAENGYAYNNSSTNLSTTYTTDDIVGVALDLDNDKIYWYKNNSLVNSGGTDIDANELYFFGVSDTTLGGQTTVQANFGNPPTALSSAANDENGYGNFEFAPPSGFLALCTKNLAEEG